MSHSPMLAVLTCPLCRNNNNCAVSVGAKIEQCWCKAVSFPPKSALIGRAPSASYCICQSCLGKIKQELALGLKRVD